MDATLERSPTFQQHPGEDLVGVQRGEPVPGPCEQLEQLGVVERRRGHRLPSSSASIVATTSAASAGRTARRRPTRHAARRRRAAGSGLSACQAAPAPGRDAEQLEVRSDTTSDGGDHGRRVDAPAADRARYAERTDHTLAEGFDPELRPPTVATASGKVSATGPGPRTGPAATVTDSPHGRHRSALQQPQPIGSRRPPTPGPVARRTPPRPVGRARRAAACGDAGSNTRCRPHLPPTSRPRRPSRQWTADAVPLTSLSGAAGYRFDDEVPPIPGDGIEPEHHAATHRVQLRLHQHRHRPRRARRPRRGGLRMPSTAPIASRSPSQPRTPSTEVN